MTILNDDELKSALKWQLNTGRTATRTSVALAPTSVYDLAGKPGAGTLAIGNTANGLVHTKANPGGYPFFPDAPAGKGWYLQSAYGNSNVACQRDLYDFIFSAGAYNFNADVTLTAQPSIEDRLRCAPNWAASSTYRAGDLCTNGVNPVKAYICTIGGVSAGAGGPTSTGSAITDGTCTWRYLTVGVNWQSLEVLVEQVTAATGNQAVQIDYQAVISDGFTLASRISVAQGVGAAPIVGRMWRLPLSTLENNIARLDRIRGSVATAGTFNVHLARRLTSLTGYASPFADAQGYDRTGLIYIPNNAAIRDIHSMASTSTATGPISLNLAMG